MKIHFNDNLEWYVGLCTTTLACYLHFTKYKSEPEGDIYL